MSERRRSVQDEESEVSSEKGRDGKIMGKARCRGIESPRMLFKGKTERDGSCRLDGEEEEEEEEKGEEEALPLTFTDKTGIMSVSMD